MRASSDASIRSSRARRMMLSSTSVMICPYATAKPRVRATRARRLEGSPRARLRGRRDQSSTIVYSSIASTARRSTMRGHARQMPSFSPRFRGRRVDVDPARVPPGQYVTRDFPVLSAGPTPHTPLDEWSLTINGAVDEPVSWPWEEFVAPGTAVQFRVTSRKSRLYHTEGIAERRRSAKKTPKGDRTGGSPISPTGVPKADHVADPDTGPDSMRAD